MKRKLIMLVLLAVAFVMVVTGCEPADDDPGTDAEAPVEVRVGMIAAENHPIYKGVEKFKEIVEEQTDGRYEIKLFPGGVLGSELEMKDQVSLGTIQMANLGSGTTVGDVPETQVFNFFHLWDDVEHMNRGYNSDVAQELLGRFEEKSGIRILANNWYQGTRHLLSKKPVSDLEDLKGLKVRVPDGLPLWNELWEAVGATTISLPWTDVYTSMQQGVVEAIEVPLNFMYDGELYKQGQCIVLTAHVSYPNYFYIGDEFFTGLPEEDQQIFIDAAAAGGDLCAQLILENEDTLLSEMEADGLEIMEIDIEAFRNKVLPVAKNWESEWGEGVFDQLMAVE